MGLIVLLLFSSLPLLVQLLPCKDVECFLFYVLQDNLSFIDINISGLPARMFFAWKLALSVENN